MSIHLLNESILKWWFCKIFLFIWKLSASRISFQQNELLVVPKWHQSCEVNENKNKKWVCLKIVCRKSTFPPPLEVVVEPRDLCVTWYIDAMPILLQGGCFQWVVGCPYAINSELSCKVSTFFNAFFCVYLSIVTVLVILTIILTIKIHFHSDLIRIKARFYHKFTKLP